MDEILRRYYAGEPAKALAEEFHVTSQHIRSTAWRRKVASRSQRD